MLTIHAIRGKVLRCKDDQEPQDAEGNEILKDFQTHRDVEVFLNGEPTTLAELNNGDRVSIRNGVKEGFKTVEATRSRKSTASQRPNAAKQIPAMIREDQAPPATTPKPESAPPTHTSSATPLSPENTAEGSLDKSEDELRRSESPQPNVPPDDGEDDVSDQTEETPTEAPPEGAAKEDKKHAKPTARRRPH